MHIKESHEGEEPEENSISDQWVWEAGRRCLLCPGEEKLYTSRGSLLSHIRQHLKRKPIDSTQAEEDPLAITEKKEEIQDSNLDAKREENCSEITENNGKQNEEICENGEGMEVDGEAKKDIEENLEQKEENGEEEKKEDNENDVSIREDEIPDSLEEVEKLLLRQMIDLLKRFGCAFCSKRFNAAVALSHHERTHLKDQVEELEKLQALPDSPIKKTHQSAVQEHANVDGPVCFKCNAVCKDNANLKNHILSHYYRAFDPFIPQKKPFECPVCEKPNRDKITLIRHYAFGHGKLHELTEVTPEMFLMNGLRNGGVRKSLKPGGTPQKKTSTGGNSATPVSRSPKELTPR